jgi:hypothetical protein
MSQKTVTDLSSSRIQFRVKLSSVVSYQSQFLGKQHKALIISVGDNRRPVADGRPSSASASATVGSMSVAEYSPPSAGRT